MLISNTGFIPQSKNALTPDKSKALYEQGMYYYANQDRDPDFVNKSEEIFGKNTIAFTDQKKRDFFVGNAVIARSGYANDPYGYCTVHDRAALETSPDIEALYRTIGAKEIVRQRELYNEAQVRKRAREENEARFNQILPNYLSGKTDIRDINPEDLDKLKQAGYGLKELHTARSIIEAYRNAPDHKEVAAIKASDLALLNGSDAKMVRSLVMQGLYDDFAQWRKDNAGFSWERMREAFASMRDSAGKVNVLNTPAISKDDPGYNTLHAILNYFNDNPAASQEVLKNRLAFLEAITQGRTQGVQSYQEDSIGDVVGDVSTMLIEMAPWLNPVTTAAVAIPDLYFDQLGKGYSIQQDSKSGVPIHDSDIVDKAAWTVYANAAVMGGAPERMGKIAGRVIPTLNKPFNKLTSTWGGAAATNAVTQALNFGVAIPGLTGAINWLGEELFSIPDELRTGADELTALQDNLFSGRYWATQAAIGAPFAAMGAKGLRDYSRQMLADRAVFKSRGGTEAQAVLTDALPPRERIQQRAEMLKENFKTDTEATIKRAIAESRALTDKMEADNLRKSEVAKAALHLDGFELAPRQDGYVDLYYEGVANLDGSFERGTKKMTLTQEDANTFIQQYQGKRIKQLTKILSEKSANASFVDAFIKESKGLVELSYFRGVDTVQRIADRAKRAEETLETRVKQLVESEGINESAARQKALQEKHSSVSKSLTLGDAIAVHNSMTQRIAQEKARNNQYKENGNQGSRAYVITRNQHRESPDSISRILRISEDASPRELAEEYGEMWMESYMAANNYSTADAYRALNDLQQSMGDAIPNLLATPLQNADLHAQMLSGDINLTPEQAEAVRRDVREAFSLLMLSDLMQKASDSNVDIPAWAVSLFDGSTVPLAEMQREAAIGAALKLAREEDWGDEAQRKLINAPAKAITDALQSREQISAADIIRNYYDSFMRQAELDAEYGVGAVNDPVATDALIKDCHDAQEEYDALHEEQLREEAQPYQEELEKEINAPQNKDKSPEQVVKESADRSIENKVQDIEAAPSADADDAFVGSKCIELQDNGGLVCKMGVISISKLELLPNFKIGADTETGVKNPLQGHYYSDHDPIKVIRSKDGKLIVFSGRHRLAKAKETGVENITCYLYDESDNYTMAWAKKYDVEMNIRDNQASPLETALYIKGEYTDGVPPSLAELAFINRKDSNGKIGWDIAMNGVPEILDALRNGRIEADDAMRISNYCPNNPIVQRAGLDYALQGKSRTEVQTRMEVALQMEKMKEDLGLANQVDLWGEPISNPKFDDFVTKYLLKKRKEISADTTLLSNTVGKKGAAERRESHGISVADERQAKQNLADARSLKERWKNPFAYEDLRKEIYAAYRKANPDDAEVPYFATEDDTPAIPDNTPIDDNQASFLFDDNGIAEVNNALITKPDADFSLSAMHASPHNFRKFSTKFMGTGEGAQAYGWGLYFMTHKGINEHYFDKFNANRRYIDTIFWNNEKISKNKAIEIVAQSIKNAIPSGTVEGRARGIVNAIKYHGNITIKLQEERKQLADWKKQLAEWQEYKKEHPDKAEEGFPLLFEPGYKGPTPIEEKVVEKQQQYVNILEIAENLGITAKTKREQVAVNYRVELNVDDSNLFMWDDNVTPETMSWLKKLADYAWGSLESHADKLYYDDFLRFSDIVNNQNKTFKGSEVYWFLSRMFKSRTAGSAEGKKYASKLLASRGYKGIKYLDGGSRDKGEGTYNYVIFDGKDIKITAVNESGRWSMDEGWEPYTDPTADFSLTSRHADEAYDTEANVEALGELFPDTGRFKDYIQGYYSLRGEKVIDNRIMQTVRMITRRQNELRSIMKDSADAPADQGVKLALEGLALIRSLTAYLPNSRRFSLEPYETFFSMYAKLHGSGNAKDAAELASSEEWKNIMMRSFENRINEVLSAGELPESDFWQTAFEQMPELRDTLTKLQNAYDSIHESVYNTFEKEREAAALKSKTAYDKVLRDIRGAIWKAMYNEYSDELNQAFRGLGLMRSARLFDKFLTRAAKQLDLYHKDIILGRIVRAMRSISPSKKTDAKPMRGKVSVDVYKKAHDYYKLMLMTPGEKRMFEESEYTDSDGTTKDWADITPETKIIVPTFDTDGEPITITVTKQEYDVYASFRAMSAAQADSAAKSLGTFLKEGKQAWKLAIEAQQKRVQEVAEPFIKQYGVNWSQKNLAKGKRNRNIFAQSRRLLNTFGEFFNEGQFLRALQADDLFGQTAKEWGIAAAKANEYIQSRDEVTQNYIVNSIRSILNLPDDGESFATYRQNNKAIREYITRLNKVNKTGINLVRQRPDFEAQQHTILREQMLRKLNAETRKKNFSPNKLAAAVDYIISNPGLMPESLAQEIFDKYSSIGDANKYRDSKSKAYNSIFDKQSSKFGHLHNINKSAKERAEIQMKKYYEQMGLDPKAPDFVQKLAERNAPMELVMSPSQAAYHVLICEQPTYTEAMRRQGYTPEVVNALKAYADKAGAMKLAYDLRDAMNERVDQIAEIYEALYGVPFPREENYFRAFFQPRIAEKVDHESEQLGYGSAGNQAISILYTRNHRTAPILPDMGLLEAFLAGMKMQDTLIGYADPANGTTLPMYLRSVLNVSVDGNTMHDAMQNAIGEEALKCFRTHIENMNRILPNIETASIALNKFMSRLGSASALGFLNFKASSLSKQIVADYNSLMGTDAVTLSEWMHSRHRYTMGILDTISLDEMKRQDFIKARYKGKDFAPLYTALTRGSDVDVTQGSTDALTQAGMAGMEKLDAHITAKSSVILYDALYRKLSKEQKDLTHEQKHEICMDECRLALSRKGQPQNFRQRSLAQGKATFLSMGNFFLGGEAINTASDLIALAARGNKGDIKRAATLWLLQGASLQAINAAYHFITDDEETRKRRNVMGYIWGSLLGPLSGVPLISNIVGMASGGIRNALPRDLQPYAPFMYANSTLPMADLERTVRDIRKAFTKKKASGFDKAIAINIALRDMFVATLAFTAAPTSKEGAMARGIAIAGTGASNIIDFLLRGLRALDERL